jgi:hypothetical protein
MASLDATSSGILVQRPSSRASLIIAVATCKDTSLLGGKKMKKKETQTSV